MTNLSLFSLLSKISTEKVMDFRHLFVMSESERIKAETRLYFISLIIDPLRCRQLWSV